MKVCSLCGQQYKEYGFEAPKKKGLSQFETDIIDVDSLIFGKMSEDNAVFTPVRTYNVCPGCMDFIYMVLGFGAPEKK